VEGIPTFTPTPFLAGNNGLVQSLVVAPNISHNGEPVKFLLDLGQFAKVRLSIFTLMGESVYQASAQGNAGANSLVWDVRNLANQAVASGLYVYVLQVEGENGGARKMGKVAIFH
jgi:hypothetical protein